MRLRAVVWLTLAALFCVLLPLSAQEARGTLLGRVTDPSNAVVVGAKVDAQNTETGVHFSSTTNGAGDYIIPFLIPGPYKLTVESQGFKTYSRTGIVVRVNDQVSANVGMELGQASQSVSVTAETPMLDTSTASMGQVVDSRTILDLPLKDGMVVVMATFAPGVTFTPETAGYTRPFDTSSPSTMSIDGTRSGSNQFMMDGAPNMQGTQIAYSPPPGVVDEFKVQGVTFDAASGFMGGAAINMSLKSGANDVHGQIYYFMQNPVLNANKYFRLAAGKPQFRLYRWGGSVSGPVYIPKLYDGHNKTFFMYGYEGVWSFDPSPWVTEAVPTTAQRTGNFSDLLALGSNYQIYDPYTIASAGGGRYSRQPLAGNIVPTSRINPISAKLAALYDMPNQPGSAGGLNNYQMARNSQDTYWNHIVRVDHNLSQKQRFYFRTNFTSMQRPENIKHQRAVGDNFYRFNRGFALDDVYVASPRVFLNTRYTLTRFITGYDAFQTGWDLAGLGFSSNFIGQINAVDPRRLKLPNINFPSVSGVQTYSNLGGINNTNSTATDIHEFAENVTTVLGAHTLRYGFAYRIYRNNTVNLGQSSGAFNFDSTWTRGPLDNSATSPNSLGQSFASFLYGLPGSGSFPINDSYAEQTKIPALYFQDDWKVSSKLTLSIGFRYERPSPLTERFNRSIRAFNATVASPIQAAVLANYAASPITQVPVNQFKVLGGITFAGVGDQPRTLWKTSQNLMMPRFGFAYSVTPKTVLRGGYGIYFDAIGVVSAHVNQTGFSQSTDMVVSNDNGLSYATTFANPFPTGFLSPKGASGGLSTNLGQALTGLIDEKTTPSYMQRWQFTLQRQLPKNHLIEVSYVANRGTRMLISNDLNSVPQQYYSTSPFRDNTAINLMTGNVTNPFYPLLPKTSLSSSTVARNQLLKPYPQYTALTMNRNNGYSWYHSMQVRVERRFSAGLNVNLSYTWSKLMEAVEYLNTFDPMPSEVISSQDRTHRLTLLWLYELPLGKGKPLGGSAPKVVSSLISGWQVQGIYTAQSGAALGFGNAIFTGNLKDIPLPKNQRNASHWFNVNAGFDRSSANVLAWNVRTFPLRFSGIRSDGPNNWDLSVIKNTSIREGMHIQFRAEAINAMNHPQFQPGSASTRVNPTGSDFGTVTGEFAWPRVIQFGLKFLF